MLAVSCNGVSEFSYLEVGRQCRLVMRNGKWKKPIVCPSWPLRIH